MSEVIVYVPAPGHPASACIARGSGIVGRPLGEDALIYYEGAIYGQAGMERFADRIRQAYRRMRERYPTLASGVIPRDSLVVVGTFHPRAGRVLLTGALSERAVAKWIGASALDPAELVVSPRWRR